MARVNLILPDKAKKELDQLAKAHGVGVQELIRDYIGLGLKIETVLEEGGKVIGEVDGQKILIADPESIYIKKLRG
jgi:hypothetical protein